MSYPLLERINAPGEIKNLPASDMPALCEEIRQFLIKSVSETGEQAKVLNRMFTEWMDQGFEQFQLPHGKKLKEMVGHTPIEVVTGAALGIVLGFAMPMV